MLHLHYILQYNKDRNELVNIISLIPKLQHKRTILH